MRDPEVESKRKRNGRFVNPWSRKKPKGLRALVKWLVFSKNVYRNDKRKPVKLTVERPDFERLESLKRDYIVWLGHSTVFIRAAGKTIITDPVFWDINFLIKRKTPFPIEPEKLPRIDYVLISHSHYDHLNTKSVKFLLRHSGPVFITGPGYERYLSRLGVTKHIVLDWWDGAVIDGLRITALPVQHWSKRTLLDTNKMLWSSYLIENGPNKYYWIGDTGYYEGYGEIGARFGPIDVLIAPIGAYEPRWFMSDHHVNPEEALRIAKDVLARKFIPTHWGTFDLTDEPLWLPIKRLKEIYEEGKNPELVVLNHGGSYVS